MKSHMLSQYSIPSRDGQLVELQRKKKKKMPRSKKITTLPVVKQEEEEIEGTLEGEEEGKILHLIPRTSQLQDTPQEEIGEDTEELNDPDAWTPIIGVSPAEVTEQEEEAVPSTEEPAPFEDLEEEEEENPPPPLPPVETFKGSLVWANLRDPEMDPFFASALDIHATVALDLRRRKGEKVPSTPKDRMKVLSPAALRSRHGNKILDYSSVLGDADDANQEKHEFQLDPEKALALMYRYMTIGYHVILFETCAQEPTLSLALTELFLLHYPAAVVKTLQEFVDGE